MPSDLSPTYPPSSRQAEHGFAHQDATQSRPAARELRSNSRFCSLPATTCPLTRRIGLSGSVFDPIYVYQDSLPIAYENEPLLVSVLLALSPLSPRRFFRVVHNGWQMLHKF